MAVIDHLVFGVPVLEPAVDDLGQRLGVEPAAGGAHPGMGTWNALLSLGDCYLEVIAPDPAQPAPVEVRPFGLDDLHRPRLVTFASRPADDETLDGLIAALRAVDHDPGDPVGMSRETPEGEHLAWQLTFPTGDGAGAIPFLIDWGTTSQPHSTAPHGVELVELVVEHPQPVVVARAWAAIGLASPSLREASRPGLRAELRGPSGSVRL